MKGAQEAGRSGGAARGFAEVSRATLSLDEVRESGLPAFFLDFGEALLYEQGRLFELRPLEGGRSTGLGRVPLPAEILEVGVGIDYGWRHAAQCVSAATVRCRRLRGRADSAA